MPPSLSLGTADYKHVNSWTLDTLSTEEAKACAEVFARRSSRLVVALI
jgi:hypothetical protein